MGAPWGGRLVVKEVRVSSRALLACGALPCVEWNRPRQLTHQLLVNRTAYDLTMPSLSTRL